MRVRWLIVAVGALLAVAPSAHAASESGFKAVGRFPDVTPVDISAAASDDVWMVGFEPAAPGSGTDIAAMLHWDGQSWTQYPAPNVPGADMDMTSVKTISPKNAWAVGLALGDPWEKPVVMHWNGTKWRLVTTPDSDPSRTVEARNAHDVWVAGVRTTEHWDGSTWTVFNNCSVTASVTGLAPMPDGSAWAVGTTATDCPPIELLQGGMWSPYASPDDAPDYISISASSANDIAVVSPDSAPHAAYWNGAVWTALPAVPRDPTKTGFADVTANAPGDYWFAGELGTANGLRTLVGHWIGSGWELLRAPNPGAAAAGHQGTFSLVAITHVPGTTDEMWAVGTGGVPPNGDHFAFVVHHP